MDLLALPDTVLHSVLELLPASDLLLRVGLVNKRLHGLVQQESLWRPRLPPALVNHVTSSAQLYCTLFGTNLLENPWFSLAEQDEARRCAAASHDVPGRAKPPWLVAQAGLSGWAWGAAAMEGLVTAPGTALPLPPPPLPPFSRHAGPVRRPAGAVAASWGWPQLVQVVDLVGQLALRGLSRDTACAFLDTSPPLEFEVHVAARFDCPGEFAVDIGLDGRPSGVPLDASLSHVWLPGCLHLATTGRMSVAVAQQWRGLAVRLEGYPAGVRRALVVLSGSEPRFWAGHFGAKFASPRLTFC